MGKMSKKDNYFSGTGQKIIPQGNLVLILRRRNEETHENKMTKLVEDAKYINSATYLSCGKNIAFVPTFIRIEIESCSHVFKSLDADKKNVSRLHDSFQCYLCPVACNRNRQPGVEVICTNVSCAANGGDTSCHVQSFVKNAFRELVETFRIS